MTAQWYTCKSVLRGEAASAEVTNLAFRRPAFRTEHASLSATELSAVQLELRCILKLPTWEVDTHQGITYSD